MREELISKESLRIAVLDTNWNDDTDADVALDMIDCMKAVEAKKIVRARWKYIRTVNGKDYYECQNCKGYDSVKSKIKTHNFCKHCGAEMEESEVEE